MQVCDLVGRYGSRITTLPDKPEETIESVVRALWLCAAGTPVSSVKAATMQLPSLTDDQQRQLGELLEQRCLGIPLAHLTGRQHFMGLEYICTAQALIPRKETEIVGNAARAILIEKILPGNGQPRVMDLCTGSGNLACAMAKHVPQCTVFAADLSPEAVTLAQKNAYQIGVDNRVKLFAGDLCAPFESESYYHSFDLITCNPPYITTTKLSSLPDEIIGHEPRMAFDAGPLGLAILWRLFQDAPRFLKSGGWLAFEVGLGQGPGLLQRLAKNKQFTNVAGVLDDQSNVRAIVAASNFKQRTRKMLEYYHADRLNFGVAGTPNRLEYDQGFFVKLGDGAADIKPIAHLYKTQVYQLAEFLQLPAEIRNRPPTTDTYSLPQSQEEFYFSVSYDKMDLILYAKNHGVSAADVSSAVGLTAEQVERVFKDIEAKRRVAAYLHAPPVVLCAE
ncbi:MAG: NAD(+) synthase [Verrucomicrobiae bacterium]|nr:NAD(+) synthase [Verrucomicrobiae bacterium]